MKINKDFSLKNLNTFKIDVYSRFYCEIKDVRDVHIFHEKYLLKTPKFIIGNGSNILFLENYYPGLIVKMNIKGKEIINENKNKVIVRAYAGEHWSEFVKWTVNKGYSGLEKLSFIPGTVGASPIQNIGAYGSEVKESLLKVQIYKFDDKKIIEINKKSCKLQYRSSIFKKYIFREKFLIISVFFVLKKRKYLKINNNFYEELRKELKIINEKKVSSNILIKAVFNIRKRKLPNTNKIGNAGSFFMNPIIKNIFFQKLKEKYPKIIGYPISKKKIKISANFLIKSIGWKKKRIGDVGVYEKKPIIIVNYGNAKGKDIYIFSKKIIKYVKKDFGITLVREVQIINNK